MGTTENMLRKALLIVGVLLPLIAVVDKIVTMNTVHVSLFLADIVMLLQFFAIGLLCLFGAHKIKPFGDQND